MKIYNKFVESKKEPLNKNDIWFDGSVFKIYKEGEWIAITLTKEAIDRIIEYAKSLDIYVMVKELPEFGEKGKIYVLQTIVGDSIELSEYVWENNSWKLVDNFNSVSLVLDNELSETSHNAVANHVITKALKNKVDKSELATPDWNASEGEEGYIKNKPFFDNINTKIETPDVNLDETNSVSIDTKVSTGLAIAVKYPVYDDCGDVINHKILVSRWDDQASVRIPHPVGFIDLTITSYDGEYYVLVFNGITHDTIDSISDVRYGFYDGYDYTLIKRIDDFYIPDTIARQEEVDFVLTEVESQNELIEDLYDTKIDKEADDYYPQLSVGTADNLAGVDVVASDFVFRRSGGGAISDGVARVESIKGNSVVWNQLIPRTYKSRTHNGVTYTVNDDGSVVANGTASEFSYCSVLRYSVFSSHKYCVIGGADNSSSSTYYFGDGNNLNTISDSIIIANPLKNATVTLACRVQKGVTAENVKFAPPILIDLTKMFQAGNEPTTIEEFYQRIPQGIDLNAYNEGEIIDCKVDAIKSVGRNAIDNKWDVGVLTDGKPSATTTFQKNCIYTPQFYRVIPNAEYYLATQDISATKVFAYISFYDSAFNYLSDTQGSRNVKVTIPNDAIYMRVYLYCANITIPLDYEGLCINLSDTEINGKYFPYTENAEDLSFIKDIFPNGMRSAGTAHDEIRYNKQTNKWEAVKRIGEVDLGTLDWVATDHNRLYSTGLKSTLKPNAGVINAISSRFIAATSSDVYNNIQDRIIATNEGGVLTIYDSAYIDNPSGFKAAMSGVMLYYELETPIVTEITADIVENPDFNLDYLVQNCGTEQMITTEPSSAIKADITYGFNAVGLIKQLRSMIEALSAQVANL